MIEPLVIALSKGRILFKSLSLLKKAGIIPIESVENNRKLLFNTKKKYLNLIILRAIDVPTYVKLGAADMGIVGKDVLLENGSKGLYEPIDFKISKCRLMTAGLIGFNVKNTTRKVATKFVNIAKRYYASKGIKANIIKLYGAMELAPIMNLAEEIIDIVDTGNTLKENGMEPKTLIKNISTRLIVNKTSMIIKYKSINPLIELLISII
ncbi:ATP phosphoribosyltransferase [Candidatus Portiera aleyrodidarum]|uniref:ATP phosphoribosyltransferase n=1 Tax=Candidatus Portiera aleyrodidarum MED (Bemisia tabaci) TaxID=1163752 RepID=A0AAU8RPI8_9GAMM|nr:ATP phosphoribosyltransferase [Candidatus Portiera aleyrodidarum]AFQ24206.1 ATP phosphoribosyltransferase (homohexameric) [Candidatus Portiera aleyrodidarum BT-B-HRs]AFS18962.1 ATP phosphoribosyltransferase [Candidatus Portiera aleyrodidarum BT-QVLC]AFT80618.1 ATP phosphoribosyltransferase catalytic subunit [Candidatus Portiera aleyrodidarum BT-QVLC]AFT80895.1 ATP phosphoribosyltransferase catalytic subunit [Candidatus Portiera aleyrodidarum BT-B-HRs]AJF24184.1 ATP phosphoribosyltransferase